MAKNKVGQKWMIKIDDLEKTALILFDAAPLA